MYTAVLMLAMTTGAEGIDFGRRGCSGCSGYYGGCYGCSGAYSGCCGGAYRTGGYAYRYGPMPYYYSSRGYYYPNGYYGTPAAIAQAPATQTQRSFYFDPNKNDATINVLLPNANADVWFDNATTKQRGPERIFHSPPLEAGATYSYTIKARWQENGRTVEQQRHVEVRPGQASTVDFRTKAPSSSESIPVPKTTQK